MIFIFTHLEPPQPRIPVTPSTRKCNMSEKTSSMIGTLSRLDLGLEEYICFHKEVIAGIHPPRFILYRCGLDQNSGGCAGLADRMKGIVNVFAMAILLRRAILIDSHLSYDFSDVYDVDDIDWRVGTRTTQSRMLINCFLRDDSECLERGFQGTEDVEILEVATNMEVSGMFVRSPAFASTFESLGFFEGNWRGKALSLLFIPNKNLVVYPLPEMAIHVRMGGSYLKNGMEKINEGQKFDRVQSIRSLEKNIENYVGCVRKIVNRYQLSRKTRIYLASDSEEVIAILRTRLRNELGLRIITGEQLGGLGHISYHNLTNNQHLRVHAEFEIFRSVQFLIAGESGLSLFAHKTRNYQPQIIFRGWDTCEWGWKTYWIHAGDR